MDKNTQFENIFDECLQSVLTGNQTIDQCIQRYPEYASELEPLLKTAMSVNTAVDFQPDPEFKKRAHLQMQLKMAESKPRRISFFGAQPRWALVPLAVMVVFLLGTSSVFAANNSMPGSPLYPIKIATENVRVATTGSDIEKARLYAEYAQRRMEEMSHMAEIGKAQNIASVVQRYNQEVVKMANVPLAKDMDAAGTMNVQAVAPEDAPVVPPVTSSIMGSAAPPTIMGSPATDQPTVAAVPVRPAPGSEVKSAGQGDSHPVPVTTGDRNPGNSSPSYGENNNTKNVGKNIQSNTGSNQMTDKEKLKQTVSYYAKMHPEELRKLLESNKVPESAKPAIRRALYGAEQNYQKTLSDLEK